MGARLIHCRPLLVAIRCKEWGVLLPRQPGPLPRSLAPWGSSAGSRPRPPLDSTFLPRGLA